MGNKFGIIELSENELKECNGGFFMSVISLFMTSGKKVIDFVEGVKEGYDRAMQN